MGAGLALPTEQQPLGSNAINSLQRTREALQKAEIIPTVIDDFHPSLTLSVTWSKSHVAELGNTIAPKHLQDEPTIALHHGEDDEASDKTYVVTLTDPDAPSRDNPKWSEMCHWIATNVSVAQNSEIYSILPVPAHVSELGNDGSRPSVDGFGGDAVVSPKKGGGNPPEDIVEYKPPGPPEKTGKHRYVFLVLTPQNGTKEPLHLSKPDDRQHWGTGEEGGGVRDWAKENGLVPVAANFIYSQNKKQ